MNGATSVAVDGTGDIYLAGSTTSSDLPTTLGTTLKGTGPNVYIAKIIPPLGSSVATLEYVTYLGGSGQDIPAGIKVDGAGSLTWLEPHLRATFQLRPRLISRRWLRRVLGKQHVFVTQAPR